MPRFITARVLGLVVSLSLLCCPGWAATRKSHHHRRYTKRVPKSTKPAVVSRRHRGTRIHRVSYVIPHHPESHNARLRARVLSPWTTPTFADSTSGDSVDGEDLVVRRAAVQALGPYNGSVVVTDPQTGRVLTIVNQRLALESGFQPCSTIKIVTSLAGLSEGVLDENTKIRIARHTSIGLTFAWARSVNSFFATIGNRLGFDNVIHYAKLYGLGEKAGWDIEGEQPGLLPSEPPKDGGVGMMTSFGEGFTQTPLELAALVSAIANGGTLYYLQYPRSDQEIAQFVPRVKRRLDIAQYIPIIKPGMQGAVEFGTARRAKYDPEDPIMGKTGTCTDKRHPTHLGWFGSYNEVGNTKLVVVVLLTGGHVVNGPIASGIAGSVYRNLATQNYFGAQKPALAIASTDPGASTPQP